MENRILGIHHITAIAGDAKRNFDFYTRILGLRMVKKTVNFDDPSTYHFYFADEVGTPGSILTFFPWGGIREGRAGTGMTTDIGYSIPGKSLKFWEDRFSEHNVRVVAMGKRFDEEYISFLDPDGLQLTLIVPKTDDTRKPWATSEVKADVATRGFHSVTLTLRNEAPTAKILTDIFGYKLQGREGKRARYITDAVPNASVVDIVEAPEQGPAAGGGGTIHHIAFRVKDEATLMEYRKKVLEYGLNITEKIDRNYFFSLYFREPGGILFEIATDNPGFDVDEPVNELGKNLKLPAQYESHRQQIEKVLPVLQ